MLCIHSNVTHIHDHYLSLPLRVRRGQRVRRGLPTINTLLPHELFAHVFLFLNIKATQQARLVCRLWCGHLMEMEGALFRKFYADIGGDPFERTKVEDWKREVSILMRCRSDTEIYAYAKQIGDEKLKESVIEDGGFSLEICRHIVAQGGQIPTSRLLVDLKYQLNTQQAKYDFLDIVEAFCEQFRGEQEGGEEEVDNARSRAEQESNTHQQYFRLKECLNQGTLIKQIRKFFLENGPKVDVMNIALFINSLLMAGKKEISNSSLLPNLIMGTNPAEVPTDEAKSDFWDVFKVLACPCSENDWMLKKTSSCLRRRLYTAE